MEIKKEIKKTEMEKYSAPGTVKTPTINFDLAKGELDIYGNCIPENSVDFFKPLIDALDTYAKSPKAITNVSFKMKYFNTSSSKQILIIFKILEGINRNGSAVSVNWIYEHDDQDMMEAGEDYMSVVDLSIKLVPIHV